MPGPTFPGPPPRAAPPGFHHPGVGIYPLSPWQATNCYYCDHTRYDLVSTASVYSSEIAACSHLPHLHASCLLWETHVLFTGSHVGDAPESVKQSPGREGTLKTETKFSIQWNELQMAPQMPMRPQQMPPQMMSPTGPPPGMMPPQLWRPAPPRAPPGGPFFQSLCCHISVCNLQLRQAMCSSLPKLHVSPPSKSSHYCLMHKSRQILVLRV